MGIYYESTEWQTIVLILDDGRRATFTGPAQLNENDKVVKVEITEPRPLPVDCNFGRIEKTL